MGLDIYAGPITRYIAGDWMTVVQRAGESSGTRVEVLRVNEPDDRITDIEVVHQTVVSWQRGLIQSLGLTQGWEESSEKDYLTDKPGWEGYGAVVLLAAYDERPDLAPGSKFRSGLRSRTIGLTEPRKFAESEAFRAASKAPIRYPSLLQCAEWCLPLTAGPTVWSAPSPNGTELNVGRVDRLYAELTELNSRTLRLSPHQLAEANKAAPAQPQTASLDDVASFGLSVLLELAEYALVNSVPWIMDY